MSIGSLGLPEEVEQWLRWLVEEGWLQQNLRWCDKSCKVSFLVFSTYLNISPISHLFFSMGRLKMDMQCMQAFRKDAWTVIKRQFTQNVAPMAATFFLLARQ